MKAIKARVSDLAEQVRGVSYGKTEAATAPRPGYVPILRAGNITDEGLHFEDLVFVPKDRVAEKQRLCRGDVVIAASSGSLDVVGKAASVTSNFDGSFGAFCKVLRPNGKVDPTYFSHFFRTQNYRRRVSALAAGANINNLRNEHLDNLELPLPPLAEQRRIAGVLDKADELRAKRRAALAELDTLTQSLFLEMFGNPVTNPRGWDLARLGEVASTSSGGTPKRDVGAYFGGQIPWVKSGELHEALVTSTEEFLTEAGLAESSAKLIEPGAVLVAMYGATVGAIALLGIKAATNQAICCITVSRQLDTSFLVSLLKRLTPSLLAKRVGGAQPNLSQDLLRNLVIPVPPLHLQQEFARHVTAVETLKAKHRAALTELDALFASLQHRAFRGQL